MSIERLNKAASAAGFAMAMPDDELVAEAQIVEEVDVPEPSRAVVISGGAAYHSSGDPLARVTGWVKSYLPAMGWRATA